MRVIMLGEGV